MVPMASESDNGGVWPSVRSYWEELAQDPRTVASRTEDGRTFVAWIGEEPTSLEDWQNSRRHLGSSGRGFKIVDLSGEVRVTHNLWSEQEVPTSKARLFAPNCKGWRAIPLTETCAYFDAMTQEVAA